MKSIASIIIALALIASTTATLQTFTFSGERTTTPDGSCPNWSLYWEATYDDINDCTGYFEVEGCLDSDVSLSDGTFTLDLYLDLNAAILTDLFTGVEVRGAMGKTVEGVDQTFNGLGCTADNTLRCFYGAGPDGDKANTENCERYPGWT